MKFNFLYMRGRVALSRLLLGLNILPGDKVAIQAFTCVAVPEALKSIGAIPVYVDVEKNSVNMSHKQLINILEENEIKAVVVQHTFGIPANIIQILETCNKREIPIIEDCCHSINTKFQEKYLGDWSHASFYSFEWGKPIIAGIGGAAKVNDKKLKDFLEKDYSNMKNVGLFENLKQLIQLIAFKIFYKPSFYWYLKDGFHLFSKLGIATANFDKKNEYSVDNVSKDFIKKMSFINQMQLLISMKKLESELLHRKKISTLYEAEFNVDDLKRFNVSKSSENADISYSRFPILVKNKESILIEAKKDKVEIASFFDTPIHPLSTEELHLVDYEAGSCPNSEDLCKQLISFPINSKIDISAVKKIATYINRKAE